MTDAGHSDQAILGLLAAARRRPSAAPAEGVSEYDWSSPSGLTPPQRQTLATFAETAAAEIAAALTACVHQQVELAVGPIVQQYAGQLTAGDEDGRYYVSLSAAGGCCGYLAVQGDVARCWVAAVLGDAAGDGEERTLSALETALLLDVIASAAEALNRAFGKAGGSAIQCGRQLAAKPPALSCGQQDACAVLSLAPAAEGEAADRAPVILLAMTNDALSPVFGGDGNARKTPERTRADMQAFVEQVAVGGEVWLAASQLAMRDVMALGEGDVLLLEAGLGDPVELTCGGRSIAWGYAAQSDGRYAIRVAGRSDE